MASPRFRMICCTRDSLSKSLTTAIATFPCRRLSQHALSSSYPPPVRWMWYEFTASNPRYCNRRRYFILSGAQPQNGCPGKASTQNTATITVRAMAAEWSPAM